MRYFPGDLSHNFSLDACDIMAAFRTLPVPDCSCILVFDAPLVSVPFYHYAAETLMKKEGKKRLSAGILFYRITNGNIEFLLVHPGGPFDARKDNGVWSIPKGEPDPADDSLFATAVREALEETGFLHQGDAVELGTIVQKGGKEVHAWGALFPADDLSGFKSNTFKMEWPMYSGKMREYPEVDRIDFFTYAAACTKIKEAQIPFLDRLKEHIHSAPAQTEPLYNLTYLEEVAMGSKEFMIEMIDRFLEQTGDSLELLRQSLDSGNPEEMRRLAHKLKPTFVIVGVQKIFESLKVIEEKTEDSDKSRIKVIFAEMLQIWSTVKTDLEHESARLKGQL
jgi:predicted NUDIX family NTP pyrophosphohydrolase/HPt (histidine-containing phosphotransfer) domain-containing protein